MDERYTEHVSTESPELIRANECEYNIGTLVTYRFRRLWNEIVDLREQLDAARRTTPDREAIESAIREMQTATSPYSTQRECHVFDMTMTFAINILHRALKTAPTSDQGEKS